MRKLSLLLLLILAVPTAAFAQPGGAPPPPPPPGYAPPPPPPGGGGYYQQPQQPVGIQRRGFLIGFSLGGGTFNCSECSDEDALSGVALDIHLGGMITPTIALMFDGWGVAHPIDGGGTIVHVMDTVAIQAWMTPQFWIKGGLGAGQLSLSDDSGDTVARSETGFGLFGAAGFEVYQGSNFALDIQGRIGSVKYDGGSVHMGALNVGFNWY